MQIAACSEDQTDNTYGALYELLTANDGRAADDLRIDVGLTRCFLTDRPGRLEPVTASAGSREGQRVTYAVLDETHLWTLSNGGRALAKTLRRNVAKMRGRSYETTNSFTPGEGSMAEDTHKAATTATAGVFYDAVQAPEVSQDAPDGELRVALAVAYGDARWVDLDRLVAEIRDPDTAWEDALRFLFNQPTDNRLKAVHAARWGSLVRPDVQVERGARVGLGSTVPSRTTRPRCVPARWWTVGRTRS
ncbi:hypothetical protein [Actinocrispum wychmicini]|uniref:Uncharacterized protein n=1 Tax=Actinocrispum wychmicini TaxID=1213861 RepID=A0A4R2J8S0_9PSEU|nr:hypothetical protein [Actinocrispum wychmicini]TCO54152.1 hypothetical protein EV192_109132 [Actinocrispum wychmicini]